MHIPLIKREGFILRPWDRTDATALVKHANNPQVAAQLRDGFPYPYTPGDAKRWLEMVGNNREDVILAIEVRGEAAGGIGFALEAIHRKAVMKGGLMMDEHLYALLKDQWSG